MPYSYTVLNERKRSSCENYSVSGIKFIQKKRIDSFLCGREKEQIVNKQRKGQEGFLQTLSRRTTSSNDI